MVPFNEALFSMVAMLIIVAVVLIIYCIVPCYRVIQRQKKRDEEWWEYDPRWNNDRFEFSPHFPKDYMNDKKYSRLACNSRSSSVRSAATDKTDVHSPEDSADQLYTIVSIESETREYPPKYDEIDPYHIDARNGTEELERRLDGRDSTKESSGKSLNDEHFNDSTASGSKENKSAEVKSLMKSKEIGEKPAEKICDTSENKLKGKVENKNAVITAKPAIVSAPPRTKNCNKKSETATEQDASGIKVVKSTSTIPPKSSFDALVASTKKSKLQSEKKKAKKKK